jgi:hypothetical protein
VQTVLTVVVGSVATPSHYMVWVLTGATVIGVGRPVTFGFMIDSVAGMAIVMQVIADPAASTDTTIAFSTLAAVAIGMAGSHGEPGDHIKVFTVTWRDEATTIGAHLLGLVFAWSWLWWPGAVVADRCDHRWRSDCGWAGDLRCRPSIGVSSAGAASLGVVAWLLFAGGAAVVEEPGWCGATPSIRHGLPVASVLLGAAWASTGSTAHPPGSLSQQPRRARPRLMAIGPSLHPGQPADLLATPHAPSDE